MFDPDFLILLGLCGFVIVLVAAGEYLLSREPGQARRLASRVPTRVQSCLALQRWLPLSRQRIAHPVPAAPETPVLA
jgi:hypothetical protein